jgi:hypothetical protein
MPQRFEDLTGNRYGRLVALRREPSERYTKWACQCDCGNLKTVQAVSLKNGDTQSCGCLFRERASKRFKGRKDRITHGLSRSPEYRVWASMLERCRNPNTVGYPRYGGRGIKVCERWDSFDNFIADMGRRPSGDYSIEREDNDGNYEPSNCRWATREEQAYNRTKTILIDYRGAKITTLEASKISGLSTNIVKTRWFKGWSAEDIIHRPKRQPSGYK